MMTVSETEPEDRRVILVARRANEHELRTDPRFIDFMDSDGAILISTPLKIEDQADPIVSRLRSNGLMRDGQLLVQSPFDSSDYYPAHQALENFTLVRCYAFAELSQALGAKTVEVREVKVQSSDRSRNGDAAATTPIGRAGIKLEHRVKGRLETAMEAAHTFAGGEPDVDEARGVLARYRLQGDPAFTSLVDMRSRGNTLHRRVVTLNLKEGADRRLDIAAQAAGLKQFRIDAEWVPLLSEESQVTATLEVNF